MKKSCILFFMFWSLVSYAQLPDWTKNKPTTSDYHMDYEVGIGVGNNYSEAEKNAYLDIMKKLISRCSLSVSTSEIMQAVNDGKLFTTINKDLNLPPIREVCSQTEILPDKKIRVYLLYQVPRDGSIINPQQYYEEFKDCNKISQFSNGKALAASFFIPGAGQMIKRRYAEGTFTLLGELVLVGGGVGTYFIGQKQLDIMKDKKVTYETFTSAQSTYKTMRIVSYSCYGVAAALYIFNLYRAYTATPRPKRAFTFYPALIPADNSTMSYGVGMAVNF